MEQKDLIKKLYVDPIESIKLNRKLLKKFRIKDRKTEDEGKMDLIESLPDLKNGITGSIIMQNWNTKNDIPEDIGYCLNYPVIIDRTKFQRSLDHVMILPDVKTKFDYTRAKIKERGELLLLSSHNQSRINTVASPRYQTTTETTEENKNYIIRTNERSSIVSRPLLTEETEQQQIIDVTQSQPIEQIILKTIQHDLIDFSTFTKHLYLRDNNFLYAKRVGGPTDFILCSYKDIKKPAFIAKKKLNSNRNVEYITMSKNTVLHYQKGVPHVYSVQEWIDNFEKYKKLMSIALFKNFKTAKLFDLWRRFFKKTKRNFYTEKLRKKFHRIDEHLLYGIFETRRIIQSMKQYNIFEMDSFVPQLIHNFKTNHKTKLVKINDAIERFRSQIKLVIKEACNKSYKKYKKLKCITLDDDANTTGGNGNEEGQDDNGGNIQNFLKDAIPYAQDATRKTHYKKLLRYIRAIDFIFNEAKYSVVKYSLNYLQTKFKRLYDSYINHWVDPPLIVVVILCYQGQILYNPQIQALREVIFDSFIQEKIYTVIYKKNFLEPQEFPNFMTCFEEVFECTVDQNSNLNNRIRDSEEIQSKYSVIKHYFDKCHQSLDEYTQTLKPILTNYDTYSKINFEQLEVDSTPSQLKDYLDKFLLEAQVIRKLKSIVNIGIFEFDISFFIDMVNDAPRMWLQKLRNVIPKVLVTKLTKIIEKLTAFIKSLSVNPVDVESFIKLKKAVEECQRQRQQTEDENNDITDLITIVNNDKEIKLQDYDLKLIIELKNLNVQAERKYDSMTYFIDNNIKNFRNDLKNQIKKFDADIKGMISELNTDTLNNYNDETFAPISFLEDKSIQISKSIFMKKSYQRLEDDLEIDELDRSNFENLDNLKYDYDLKVQIWNSVKDFQDMIRMWNGTQVLTIDIPKTTALINQWIELCNVGIVDLDFPNVPKELLRRIMVYKDIIPVLIAIQNKNVTEIDYLLAQLKNYLGINYDLNNEMLSLEKLIDLPKVPIHRQDINELNNQANEERRIKDTADALSDCFYSRRIPLKLNAQLGEKADKFYITVRDANTEYDFIENNIMAIAKLFLCPYCSVIKDRLVKLNNDFMRYRTFLDNYIGYQKYLEKSDGIINNGEFAKEMPADHKKLVSENVVKALFKIIKDNLIISRFLENACEKIMTLLNSLIQSFELNYKAISQYLDKKRREFPKFFLLSDQEMAIIFSIKESNEFKQTTLIKLFPFIKEINLGNEIEDLITITTTDDENIQLKNTKSGRGIKDYVDLIENGISRKIKDIFRTFKKEFEASIRPKSKKKPRDIIFELIESKENLAQTIFNSLHSFMVDSLEKALISEEEAFDRLFDLYNESKDDRKAKFISMVKDPQTTSQQRKILINMISLENYYISMIEVLIREDVSRTTDYYFQKIISTKIENDNYIIKILNIVLDYGFEYVGLQSNFVMIPESDRMFATFANCIQMHQAFLSYGIKESGNKEICQSIAGFFGKRITYVNATRKFGVEGFNNVLYANLKNGGWICLDKAENIQYELLSALALRIAEVIRLIKSSEEDSCLTEMGEKFIVNFRTLNIFMMRSISESAFNRFHTSKEIPIIIKDHFRLVSFNLLDYHHYITLSLLNLGFSEANSIARKILFIIQLICHKSQATKSKLTPMIIFSKLHQHLLENTEKITPENELSIVRECFHKGMYYMFTIDELEEFNKYCNEILKTPEFDHKAQSIRSEESNEDVDQCINDLLSRFKFNNNIYETKLLNLFYSLNSHHSFLVIGPALSGKTNALIILRESYQLLNSMNPIKYPLLFAATVFPKSMDQSRLFAINKVETAHQLNNNYFDNLIGLFNIENFNELETLNHQDTSQYNNKGTKRDHFSPPVSPTRLASKLKANTKDKRDDEELFQVEEEKKEETKHMINSLIFDGQIDPTWIEYINSIYDQQYALTRPNGKQILATKWKLFFETDSLKHASPSFITRQFVVSLTYETFGWENILYSWVETNTKITANDSLKNYIRGLFENFFPKVWDFILNNKLQCVPMTENYTLKNLIAIFDSLFPLFNFDEKVIGRRHFNVVPKIELIKKSTLSIFIFSCAWTMLFFSNFVIQTKIEKLISDIFKADDLKGPIFDYFINETTNDYDEWKNLIELPEFKEPECHQVNPFFYNNIFVHSTETISYWWICQKFISSNTKFLIHGKPSNGKTFLLFSLLKNYEQKIIDLKTLQILITTNTSSIQLEQFINDSTQQVKRNIIGDQFGRKMVLFVDDIHMAAKDQFNSSDVKDYLRRLSQTMNIYDNKKNIMKYLDKFNIVACGNMTNYPLDENEERFMDKFALITYYLSEASITNIFRVTLEFHLRKVIPNTSGITSAQYIQASIKLNELLRNNIAYEPTKLHIDFTLRDITTIIQAFHMFNYKGNNPSDYPEYLKKLFFYDSTRVYEAKFTNPKDISIYRKCICEAYSSSFKQDKTTPEVIFNNNWDTPSSYIFQREYLTPDSTETIFYESKQPIYDFIKEKLITYYAKEGIKNTNLIMLSENNMLFALKILRILESNNRNLVLIGKEYSGKESLFKLCAYIIGYDVIEVDEMWLRKSKEVFNKEITIGKVLINCTYSDRKTILFAKSTVVYDDHLLETITYLLNPNEIKSNYSFINNSTYGDLDENILLQRIKNNFSMCLTINHNSNSYRKLHILYPSIIKQSNTLYQKNFNEELMKSLVRSELKEVIPIKTLSSLDKVFLQIHSYAKELSKEYSKKLGFKLKITQKQFEQMISFYNTKHSQYKTILQSKENTYIEALMSINKCESAMSQLAKEIEDILPDKQDTEKQIEEKKREIAVKTSEKSQWKMKRIEEEKPIPGLEAEKAEKETFLQGIFAPFKESLEKTSISVSRISSGDITEIKNTWDSLTFGKFILGKIYELLGDNNNDWDYTKKTLDVKIIKAFYAINPLKESKELIRITSEIVSSPEFASGDKFQKPFKTCGVLCDYFASCQRYFNEINNQRAILDEIEVIKEKIAGINKKVKEYLSTIKDIENYIIGLEKSIDQLDKKKSNLVSQIEKKENLKQVLNDFNQITKDKKSVLTSKKEYITSILLYFDFYLLFIASYCVYAPPFNKSSRNKLKGFIYSQTQALGIEEEKFKEISLSELITALLDSSGSDKDFLTSLGGFEEFYKENFMIIHLFKSKVPYIIDINRYSKNILMSFIQYKEMSSVVVSDYSSSDFIDKLDSAMRNGSVLIIEDCEEETYSRMRNFIFSREGINDKGRKTVEIDGLVKEKGDKFQLYLIKTKSDSSIHSKAWVDTLLINFNCTNEMIQKQLFKYLVQEQDPRTYSLYTKARNDISKDQNKVFELEKKMLITINQVDVSASVDKLQFNTSLLEQYRLENQTYSLNITSLEANKTRFGVLTNDLNRFKLFSSDSGKIYKIMSLLFPLEPLYCISLDYFSLITRRFFKEHFGFFKDLTVVDDALEDQRDILEDEEIDDNKPKKKKGNKNISIPSYEKNSLLKLILEVYDKIVLLYSNEKRRNILLLLLFFYLKEKDEIPSNYKNVIGYVTSIYFNGNIDSEGYDDESPIDCITKYQWNCLKQINDLSSYILSIVIDHMENHGSEWSTYLQPNKPNINTPTNEVKHYLINSFELFTEELECSVNPFIKFILFSILRPENCEFLMTTIIQSILSQNVSVPSLSLQTEICNQNNNLLLIILPLNISFEESIGKELQDVYYPKLLAESSNSLDLVYKEITAKGELSPAELELIHQGIRTGGMFVIKNAHLPKDTLGKLCEEIKEGKATINENFKLLLIDNNKSILSNALIDNCIIINRDINLLTDIKEYIIDLVKNLPSEYLDLFINRKGCNALYTKKVLIGMIMLAGVFVQYDYYHSGIITVPIEYKRNDFFLLMQFISSYLNTLSDDKIAQMTNIENILGFNYNSLITIAIDSFYSSRLVYKEDITRLEKITQKIFDEETILNENYYFVFNSLTILSKNNNNDITLDEFAQLFKDIPNEDYYNLLPNISSELIKKSFKDNLQSFYSLTHSIVEGIGIKSKTKINSLNIELVRRRLIEFKQKLPDLITKNDIHPQLFKLTKMNDYVNPLDDVLDKEINSFNDYIQTIINDINIVMKITKGDMVYVDQYTQMIYSINGDDAPLKWRNEQWCYNYRPQTDNNNNSSKNDKITLNQLSNIIANHLLTFTKWLKKGSLKIYPINQFNYLRLFFDTLYLHFIKSKPENTIEQIKLHFFLTHAKESNDLDDSSIENYKLKHGKDIIFCKGIQITNGLIDEKHILKLNANDLSLNQRLPIFGVSFSIDLLKKKNVDESADEEEEEDNDDNDNEAEVNDDNELQVNHQEGVIQEEEEFIDNIHVAFYDRYGIEVFSIKEPFGLFEFKYHSKDNMLNLKGVKITVGNNEEEMNEPKPEIEESQQEQTNEKDNKQEKN